MAVDVPRTKLWCQYKSTEYKITEFGLEFAEKSRFEIEVEFDRKNNWKTKIKMKLNLIYYSKCKSNAKSWKIRMKTRNPTQSRARNDPINRRIQRFSFRDFENKVWHSRCDFFWFPRSISEFKHSSDMETSQEDLEIKRFSDCGV